MECEKMSKVMNPKEIMKKLNVSESTFIDLVFNEGLPAKRNAVGVFEVTEKDLDAWKNPIPAKKEKVLPLENKKPEKKSKQ